KVFQAVGFEDFRAHMRQTFEQVLIRKPDSSRDRSTEVYLLGKRPLAAQQAAVTSPQEQV
ncbi:MAG: SAM-dependent methyltransferase, partial [Thiobacillus sp.]|nr:SAM-dependent methyltransferase [Thiobacillus sp.]